MNIKVFKLQMKVFMETLYIYAIGFFVVKKITKLNYQMMNINNLLNY